MPELKEIPVPLLREFAFIRYAGFTLLIVFTVFFNFLWPLAQAIQWLLQTTLVWLLITVRVKSLLKLNRASLDSPLFPSLGLANQLTILRGFLIALCSGFIFQPGLSEKIIIIPALSYFIAAVIDRIDGFLARSRGEASLLGCKLDTEFDALGLLVAPVLAIWLGQIHWSYLSVSLAYYLFQWGIFRRKQQGLLVHELPQNMSRRALAGFQMGFLAVVLWPILAPPATTIAGFAFMFPLLLGFAIDWLTVSGKISLSEPETSACRFLHASETLLQGLILPIFRGLTGILLIYTLMQNEAITSSGEAGEIWFSGILLVCGSMILLGIFGRLFAVILSCLLCWFYLDHDMTTADSALLIVVVLIMQYGTGKFSLWRWDEHWVNRYDGDSSQRD